MDRGPLTKGGSPPGRWQLTGTERHAVSVRWTAHPGRHRLRHGRSASRIGSHDRCSCPSPTHFSRGKHRATVAPGLRPGGRHQHCPRAARQLGDHVLRGFQSGWPRGGCMGRRGRVRRVESPAHLCHSPTVQPGAPELQAIGTGVVHQHADRSRGQLRDHLVPTGCSRRSGRSDHGYRRCLHALVSSEGVCGSSGIQRPIAGQQNRISGVAIGHASSSVSLANGLFFGHSTGARPGQRGCLDALAGETGAGFPTSRACRNTRYDEPRPRRPPV